MILAEDQVLLREGLARLFADLGHEVTAALEDVARLEERVSSDRPNLVVLDIRMPPTHTDEGATAARAVKAQHPDLGVLLLSQHVETGPTADLLGLPAFGYLLKDRVLDVGDFVDACERVSRGGSALDPKVVEALLTRREASPSLTSRNASARCSPTWRKGSATPPSPIGFHSAPAPWRRM